MKCPICNEELDVYDTEYRFSGNYDKYADCKNCHHSFIFMYRYHHLWKYHQWNQYFDKERNTWFDDENTEKIIKLNKGGKK